MPQLYKLQHNNVLHYNIINIIINILYTIYLGTQFVHQKLQNENYKYYHYNYTNSKLLLLLIKF